MDWWRQLRFNLIHLARQLGLERHLLESLEGNSGALSTGRNTGTVRR
jgi:hypothetical protein